MTDNVFQYFDKNPQKFQKVQTVLIRSIIFQQKLAVSLAFPVDQSLG